MHCDRLLESIVQLSERMRETAEGGDWVAVAELELERRGLIGDCFAQQGPFQDAELAVSRIRRVLDLDRKLMEMGAAQKGEIGAALSKLRQGRTAIDAYRRCPR